MIIIPLNLLTPLLSECTYIRPKGVIHKYTISPDSYLSHLCACIIVQTHRATSYNPTYVCTLWLLDMRVCQLVSIHSLNTLSYEDTYYMRCYFNITGSIVIRGSKYSNYEVTIALESLKFISKSYENYFRALLNDYFYYINYLTIMNASVLCHYAPSLFNEVNRLSKNLINHINYLP